MKKLPTWLKLGLVFVSLILADQLTKFYLPIKSVNSGISFGWLAGFNYWLIISLLIGVWLTFEIIVKAKTFPKKLMLVFFLAGAVSNLIDRLIFSGVRDWWSWPILGFNNNLADIWITIGLLGIIYFELWNNQ